MTVMFLPLEGCDLTLGEFIAEMARLQREHPDMEVYLGGDEGGIVGRPRA